MKRPKRYHCATIPHTQRPLKRPRLSTTSRTHIVESLSESLAHGLTHTLVFLVKVLRVLSIYLSIVGNLILPHLIPPLGYESASILVCQMSNEQGLLGSRVHQGTYGTVWILRERRLTALESEWLSRLPYHADLVDHPYFCGEGGGRAWRIIKRSCPNKYLRTLESLCIAAVEVKYFHVKNHIFVRGLQPFVGGLGLVVYVGLWHREILIPETSRKIPYPALLRGSFVAVVDFGQVVPACLISGVVMVSLLQAWREAWTIWADLEGLRKKWIWLGVAVGGIWYWDFPAGRACFYGIVS